MHNLNHVNVRKCVKRLADNIRAENIDYSSYLDLYSGAENIENIDNRNNTVIYGRRGSGKTHLLKALQERISNSFNESRNFPVYVDLRKIIPLLASDQSDSDVDAILTFKYLMQEIAHTLACNAPALTRLNEFDPNAGGAIRTRKEELRKIFTRIYVEFDGQRYTKPSSLTVSEEEVRSLSAGAKFSAAPGANLDASIKLGATTSVKKDGYISILEISNDIERLLEAADLNRITVLLDEWSEISASTQLYLAELIKKTFSAIPVTVKIAAIPNRTNLGIKTDRKFVGLEDGGDITSYPLDMRYVFEVNKTQTRGFFNDLLMRHLYAIDGPCVEKFLVDSKKSADTLINAFFANVALNEILVACAGIPRDFMNLFINSYDRYLLSSSASAKRISVKNIRSANAEWYETDKKEQVDKHPAERQLLAAIVEEIVRKRKSIHFLVPEKYAQNVHIQNLIDFRVMHLRKSGYSHKDHSGAGYNVYSVDYGCYNSINIAKNKLDTSVLDGLNVKELRDIRRISLEDSFFSGFLMSVGEAFLCEHCRLAVDTNHLAYIKQGLCNNCFEPTKAGGDLGPSND